MSTTDNDERYNSEPISSTANNVDEEEVEELDIDEELPNLVKQTGNLHFSNNASHSRDIDIEVTEVQAQNKFDFDKNTIVVNLQILPKHENERKVLIAVGIVEEIPLLNISTLDALEESSLPILQALEKLKESLPQMQALSQQRQQHQQERTQQRQVIVPDLPRSYSQQPSNLNQLKLF